MKTIRTAILIASLSIPASGMINAARADDSGRVAAGVAGGFLGGMFLGSILSQHPRPAPPPPAYEVPPPAYAAESAPAYYAPPPCHWAPGRPFWDEYYGVWRHPRVRVCE
jgi:hypothetical protein